MHGYQHLYETKNSGLIGLNNYLEFAGLPYEVQAEKIKKAWEIFTDNGIRPKIWMAPAHSFDLNTLKALKEYTEIEYITDGFAVFPFTAYGFKWIPQQLWRFRNLLKKIFNSAFNSLYSNLLRFKRWISEKF